MSAREWEVGEGGIDVFACLTSRGNGRGYGCWCGRCARCGHPLHSAVHGHPHGGKHGDKPFDHRFEPLETDMTNRRRHGLTANQQGNTP